jgi:uncharacterized membrane protein
MQQITAGAASEKINELKSKLAIYKSLVELIHANYIPSDGGAAEVRITRDDGGSATDAHFASVLEDIEGKCVELREELAEWEGLVFSPRGAQVTPIHVVAAAEQVKKSSERTKPHVARRAQPSPK